MQKLVIKPGQLSLENLRMVWQQTSPTGLDPDCHNAILVSAQTVERIVAQGSKVYGINTGFGKLANKIIPSDQLEELQRRIVLSHAAGVGSFLEDPIVRLIMILKINNLAQGYSGIRLEVIEALIKLYNGGIFPCIPAKGSVGASGDLAPLAHMSAVLLGVGSVKINGEVVTAVEGLKRAGLKPLNLAPKEGLALLNGTQVSTALALAGLFHLENIFSAAIVSGSLSVDAAAGSLSPFDPQIQLVRRQMGQISIARIYRELLANSEIHHSHANCERIQDPYSLRCQPQVMGSCLDYIKFVSEKLLLEANAVSDNPLVFSKENKIISGGNFHAEPVSFAADSLALCFAEVGNLSERRTALLMDPHLSGLPAFLVSEPGINSGFMLAQVTAAALVSENKLLAHPASVDSIPTSANQEDHVSMATHGARRLLDMAENAANVVAVELLAACQGIDFRKPLQTSPKLQKILQKVREVVPFYDQDRFFAPDIAASKKIIDQGFYRDQVLSLDNNIFLG